MFAAESTVLLLAVGPHTRFIAYYEMAASRVPVADHFVFAHYEGYGDFTGKKGEVYIPHNS